MEVKQPLLINGVMITPADISAAKVQKSSDPDSQYPFMVLCDIFSGQECLGDSRHVAISVPVSSEENGQSVVQQIWKIKQDHIKLALAKKTDSDMLKELLELVKARLPESDK